MTCSHSDAGSNNGIPRGFATKNEVVIVKSSLPNNTQNVLFKVQWSRVLPPQRPPKPAHGQLNLAALPPTPSTHVKFPHYCGHASLSPQNSHAAMATPPHLSLGALPAGSGYKDFALILSVLKKNSPKYLPGSLPSLVYFSVQNPSSGPPYG